MDLEPVEEALWRAAERRFGPQVRRQKDLVRAIKAQSARYTSRRAEVESFSGPASLLARALFFTLADLPKPVIALEELADRYELALPPRLRVLDVGAGCGAMSFGALLWLQRHHTALEAVQLYALDHDQEALTLLSDALQLMLEVGAMPTTRLETARVALERPSAAKRALARKGPYELILAGTVLNELPPPRGAALVRQLLEQLSPQGILLISEPALKDCARTLHALRDQLLADDACRVLAPCTHAEPCPLVAHKEHWCHESRVWSLPPPRMRRVAAACGLRRRDIKFSLLALQHPDGPALPQRQAMSWRVVGSPGRLKGRAERWLCGEEGLHRARCLERDRRDENEAFFASRRGELLTIDGADEHNEQRLNLASTTRVEARDPAKAWAAEHDALSY